MTRYPLTRVATGALFGVLSVAAIAQEKDPQKMLIGDEVIDSGALEIYYLGALASMAGILVLMVVARLRYGPRGGMLIVAAAMFALTFVFFALGI